MGLAKGSSGARDFPWTSMPALACLPSSVFNQPRPLARLLDPVRGALGDPLLRLDEGPEGPRRGRRFAPPSFPAVPVLPALGINQSSTMLGRGVRFWGEIDPRLEEVGATTGPQPTRPVATRDQPGWASVLKRLPSLFRTPSRRTGLAPQVTAEPSSSPKHREPRRPSPRPRSWRHLQDPCPASPPSAPSA